MTLEMGYKEIHMIVYTRRDIVGCHNDAPPEMASAPILSATSAISPQIGQIL